MAASLIRRLAAAALALACALPTAAREGIGVNKFDLLAQYLGVASGGDGSQRYRRMTVAMARKSIADAADAGVPFMRVAMLGYGRETLGRLLDEPATYWAAVDEMSADLRAASIALVPVLMWNARQLPQWTGEDLGTMIRDPRSRASRLLAAVVERVVRRLSGDPVVLFWEATNELNLLADLDHVARCRPQPGKERCEGWGNFTTDEMIAFGERLAALIRAADPARRVSSGYSAPRRSAESLRRYGPQPRLPREAWTPDSEAQFQKNLSEVHRPFDIVSIHVYPEEERPRFGGAVRLIELAKQAADRDGKVLFVGEFGERRVCVDGTSPFISQAMEAAHRLKVPYAAVWVWQFYRRRPYAPCDPAETGFNVEPAQSPAVVEAIRLANERYGNRAPRRAGPDATPPRVVATWPLECAALEPGQQIHAVASDDSGSVTVELLLAGRRLAQLDRAPFSAAATLDGIPAGEHELIARARDAAGNGAQYATRVRIGGSVPSDYCRGRR